MGKYVYIVTAALLLTLLSGCNVGDLFKTKNDELLFDQVMELQQQIEHQKWEEALANIENFEAHYANQKWKMQLLGELEDYQDIELEIERLKVNVQEQDEYECMLGLKQIQYRLAVIYTI
ncbi:DUF4363 family protein [Halalkalibacterium halodurans]|uniref:BH1969 protein n=1 Tax=Halalkalibacterium halodurans (strain ATCC BAA-125 / DSM 18197 / FERM 7344 / JCM 9153 / C-125) TaxID=272558 RepID=Q9KBF9_HALH5|nr:DUF4363 family protein [Halalkalibacterium halodurans]MED4125117.1 DUF4363 family protein [Halalkalibacterium halodurans]MED4172794.1 DUF4363 family protein [Halalkalibacterium halodurans]BAB05688.1 BH1969 [Halalkalibacterium halodurans C-125]